MNEFHIDNDWSHRKRDEYLKPHYITHSEEGRFVFCDKGDLAKELQQAAVDTIMQGEEGRIWAIEEKIVRWKGRRYTALALETWSCTVPGRERQGWMYTAKCDVLLYCFEQEDGSLLCYAIPFGKLQYWFFDNSHFEQYPTTQTKQINHSECRVVPIDDVLSIGGCKCFTAQ